MLTLIYVLIYQFINLIAAPAGENIEFFEVNVCDVYLLYMTGRNVCQD